MIVVGLSDFVILLWVGSIRIRVMWVIEWLRRLTETYWGCF